MKLLYSILIIVVSIYVVIGQDASKFSEAELDREDQDFEPLARGHVAAKHSAQQLSTSKFISPQRFKEESEGLVAACHKMYWTPMTATDKPASFFDSMVAGSVAGSEKYIYAVDIQTDGSKVQRLNVETKNGQQSQLLVHLSQKIQLVLPVHQIPKEKYSFSVVK